MRRTKMFKKGIAAIGPCYFADNDGQDGTGSGGVTSDMLNGGGAGGAGGGTSNNDGGTGGTGGDFDFEAFKSEYGKNYADKGFMQELTTPEKMFEKINNMESMIGKKSLVPGENATEQEWTEFRGRVGLKSADDYQLDNSSLPDNVKNLHNADVEGKIKKMFYDAGVTPYQAKIINQRYDEIMLESHKELIDQVAEQQKQQQLSDVDFDNIANETWGNDRENVQNVAKALIQEFTPETLKPHLQNMDNKNLIIMASVLKGVSDKYISQDDLSALRNNTKGAQNPQTLRQEAQKELAKLSSMDPFDPGYEAQKQKVQDLYSNFSSVNQKK